MKIAVLGSGGREHAIAWKLAQHTDAGDIYVIPGNGGTSNNVDLPLSDFASIKHFCQRNHVELIIVGPEQPLVDGIVDYFNESGILVFGPDRNAAQLEGSKIFSKHFMKTYGVSTADFWVVENGQGYEKIIDQLQGDLVLKFDGLAAGKGVFVCSSVTEAQEAVRQLQSDYGAHAPFLIEQKLQGKEISIIGFTDGKDMKMLLPSQDHKPIYDGDKGPNTGGMGAYCPVPFCDDKLLTKIYHVAIEPTLRGIRTENMNYKGALYFGLMISDNDPYVLEYNVRLGDPETEVILPALKSDLRQLLLACLNGTLKDFPMEFHPGYFVDVVLASQGYPKSYEKGFAISGSAEIEPDTFIFHAGTKRENDTIITAGGRVLNVVARADSLETAIEKTYRRCDKIYYKNMYYRSDIGRKGLMQ